MVHWSLGQYVGVGGFGSLRIPRCCQSNSSEQNEIILDIFIYLHTHEQIIISLRVIFLIHLALSH